MAYTAEIPMPDSELARSPAFFGGGMENETMRKKQELTDPMSCMSRARDDEMTFVLLGRDAAAPTAVRAWVDERIRLQKNKPGDSQIVGAMEWIDTVEQEQRQSSAKKPKRVVFTFDERSLCKLYEVVPEDGLEIVVRDPDTGKERVMLIPRNAARFT